MGANPQTLTGTENLLWAGSSRRVTEATWSICCHQMWISPELLSPQPCWSAAQFFQDSWNQQRVPLETDLMVWGMQLRFSELCKVSKLACLLVSAAILNGQRMRNYFPLQWQHCQAPSLSLSLTPGKCSFMAIWIFSILSGCSGQ